MKTRQNPVPAVAKAEAELMEVEQSIAVLEVETTQATARVAADQLNADVTPEQAVQLRQQARQTLDAERARLAVLRDGLPVLRADAAARAERDRLRRVERGRQALREAVQVRDRAAMAFAQRVQEAAKAGHELERHRLLVAAARAEVVGLLQQGEHLAVHVDELEQGSDVVELRRMLAAGPQRPEADRQRETNLADSEEGGRIGDYERFTMKMLALGLSSCHEMINKQGRRPGRGFTREGLRRLLAEEDE